MKEIARIKPIDIMRWPVTGSNCLMSMLIGKNIINNPKICREDEPGTGDIVFKEIE